MQNANIVMNTQMKIQLKVDWYKEVALVTSLHVQYILLCFHHTNDTNSKCLYKKYYTYLIHMGFNNINVILC